MVRHWSVVVAVAVAVGAAGCSGRAPAAARNELPRTPAQRTLEPAGVHRYRFPMKRGESCELVVTQQGIDVVVEGLGPDGTRLVSVDSPNGSEGDEPVEILATRDGEYQLVVRALESSQSGRYTLAVKAMRDTAATRAVLDERARARGAAIEWLRARAGAIELRDATVAGAGLDRFDLLARRGRIVGLGEATHGSRQFGDVRLALTRRLIERHGVRVIGLEGSAARMRLVDAWARGDDGELATMIGAQWINRRAFIALATEVRAWNVAHPDDLVSIVGLDDGDHAPARDVVAAFARRTFDAAAAARVDEVLARLATADAQAMVFGPSDVSADDWRFLTDLVAKLEAVAPESADAIAAARTLAQVAEFNAGGPRSRDWMMAENLMRVLGPETRAVYWGHNAHVGHPRDRLGPRAPTGGRLAELAPYVAIAITFHEGGFLAQLPDDPQDRLQTFTLPAAADDSIDAVLAGFGDSIATWPDGADDAPPWLRAPRAMHWIGALFSTEFLPSQWTRDTALLADFDGVVMIRHVDAEASTDLGKNRAP